MFLLFFFLMVPRQPRSTLFPYTTLFRSIFSVRSAAAYLQTHAGSLPPAFSSKWWAARATPNCSFLPASHLFRTTYTLPSAVTRRSEEHTSELQSQSNLVCRLLLEKKNKI